MGVHFDGGSTLVTTANGAISITGVGYGNQGANFGVVLGNGAQVTSTGTNTGTHGWTGLTRLLMGVFRY